MKNINKDLKAKGKSTEKRPKIKAVSIEVVRSVEELKGNRTEKRGYKNES